MDNKNKIMDSYKKMCKFLQENNFPQKKLEKTKVFKYKEHEYEIPAGSMILDCDEKLYSRILYVDTLAKILYLHGDIKLSDLKDVM